MWSGPAAPRLRSFHASGLMSLRRGTAGPSYRHWPGLREMDGPPALEEGQSSAGSRVSEAELMQ